MIVGRRFSLEPCGDSADYVTAVPIGSHEGASRCSKYVLEKREQPLASVYEPHRRVKPVKPIHHSNIVRALVVSLLLLLTAVELPAQLRDRIDHRGKEFRIAFLHTNGADGESPAYKIVVACERPTTGTITYESTGRTFGVAIFAANTPQIIELDTISLLMPDPVIDGEISDQSLTVRFNDEVTLYGINTLRWSSDAFLGIPLDAIGQDYTIMSYPSTSEPGPAGQIFETSDFPSQFAVVATQNGTQITVTPTVSVNARGNTAPFTVTLQSGEVFFGQAVDGWRLGNPVQMAGRDMTGTRITSSKPIIVYGSHQRTNIPWTEAVGRDHLVEQMPPTDKWGYRAIITPHYQIEKTVPDENVFRVVAAFPGTTLIIDSTTSIPLVPGRALELPLDGAKLLMANKPISVAQFQRSTVDVRYISLPNDTVGDPFMMLIPPPEQYDSSYTFNSWDTKDFFYHFINVVIPNERVGTLLLDGQPITEPFRRIPKTSYSYAQIPMRPGGHHISARVPFGLYIYGYGPYNSYGFPGGMVFDSIFTDHIQPDIRWRDTCGGVVGAAFDTMATDFGMESLRLESARNVALVTEPFEPGADSIRFALNLIDPYSDGDGELVAVDTAGLERRYRVRVKGFTVRPVQGEPMITLDTLASLNGLEFCTTISLRNYGSFPQEIDGLTLTDPIPGLRVNETFPITLGPGEIRAISICFRHVGDTAALVEIGVDNGCLVRPVAFLPLLSGIDSVSPAVTRISADCDKDIIYEISELWALNSGIAEVTVKTRKNADIIIPSPNDLPGRTARIEIRRKSIWEDVIYEIEVVDLVGNQVNLRDTIGGLTLSITDEQSDEFGFRLDPSVPWEYRDLIYSQQDCDTVWIQNTGLRRLDLYRLRFSGNLEFSVPPEQLPLQLEPGERIPVEVCVRPTSAGQFIDTMFVEYFCGSRTDVIAFRSNVEPLVGNGRDMCGNLVRLSIGGAARRNFLENPSPNPTAKSITKLTFGLSRASDVSLALYDINGHESRLFLQNNPMPEGIAQIEADLSDLPTGDYILVMRVGTGELLTRPLIIQQ